MEVSERVQSVIQELQIVSQQVAALRNQQREVEVTSEHISKHPEGRAVYRQAGAILIEVDDVDTLKDDLANTTEKISEALERLVAREAELREEYETIAKQYEGQ